MAWLVMMASGLALGAVVEFRLGHLHSDNFAEYATAYLLAMPIPFAVVIATVDLPLVMAVRALRSGPASPVAFGAACTVVAPFAVMVLVALGSVVWGPPTVSVPTLVAPLLAIALGGLAFGLAFGWFDRCTGFSN